MPKTTVVAFDFSRKDGGKLLLLVRKPFIEQLREVENHIRKVCDALAQEETDEWIISWREYGLTNGFNDNLTQNRYLTVQQKAELKKVMAQLTQEYPKLTIISGTVATKRIINLEKQPEKLIDLKEGFESVVDFTEELQQYMQRVFLGQRDEDMYLVRNTAYVFSHGVCTARHDKTELYEETLNFISKEKVIFRPGKGRSYSPFINEKLGIEICLEHDLGFMADKVAQLDSDSQKIPLIQFVLSDSVPLTLKHLVSPYGIHIDSHQPISLITDKTSEQSEVSLYSYDLLTKEAVLKPVKPQTRSEFLMSQIMQEGNYESSMILGDKKLPDKKNDIFDDTKASAMTKISDSFSQSEEKLELGSQKPSESDQEPDFKISKAFDSSEQVPTSQGTDSQSEEKLEPGSQKPIESDQEPDFKISKAFDSSEQVPTSQGTDSQSEEKLELGSQKAFESDQEPDFKISKASASSEQVPTSQGTEHTVHHFKKQLKANKEEIEDISPDNRDKSF